MKKAVVLISGGLDSATTLAIALEMGYECYGLTVNYGQRHVAELQSARKVTHEMRVKGHELINVDLTKFGGSALTEDNISVPKNALSNEGIPVTYVPTRNTILLGLACSLAEAIGADSVFIGVNALDFSGYPDCRPDFIDAFQMVLNVGTKRGVEGNPVKIEAPLIRLRKAQIISIGESLGVPFADTISCYHPDRNGRACGACDSCILRREGFENAGIDDPTIYQET